jgi:transposase
MVERGYNSNAIVTAIEAMNAVAAIPPKIGRKRRRPHGRALYKLRNRIEPCFSRLKYFRRLATRYWKRRVAFRATVRSPSPAHGCTSADISIQPS